MLSSIGLMKYRGQRGALLVMALIVLWVMTLIGLAAIQATSLAEKMAGNLRDLNAAMQSAESALREAESFIDGLSNTRDFGKSSGLYTQGSAPNPYTSSTWQAGQSLFASGDMGKIKQPQYFIEYINDYGENLSGMNVLNYGSGSIGTVSVFRIVARGTGLSGTASAMLEVFYGKQFSR